MQSKHSIIISTLFFFIMLSLLLSAESFTIPSKFTRDRVIILTSVNDSRPLELILDTGMGFKGVYLFDKDIADEIDMTGAVEARVPGFGAGEPSRALMITDGCLKFDEIHVDSQPVIISQSEYTQKFRADGVVGWNLFGHYTVEINYDDEQIILHDTASFQPDSGWISLPLTLENNLPIIAGSLEVAVGEIIPVKLNIDLGYKGAIQLVLKPDRKFTLPQNLDSTLIGTGLSGDVHGMIGKCQSIILAEFALNDITTTFAPLESWAGVHDVAGIVGNDFMRRFNAIYDYTHKTLYLRPSKYFAEPFK